MNIKKKAQGLPVNIVVTVIIAIVIFGLGLGLFSKFFEDGETTVQDIVGQVETGIASIECEGDEWICSPSNKLKNGDSETFAVYIANRANEQGKFSLMLTNLETFEDGSQGISKECGDISVIYLNGDTQVGQLDIESGESASIPFNIKALTIRKTPCSFVISAAIDSDLEEANLQKTSVIVTVE